MHNKIRVGIVNYLNTKPLLFGIEHSEIIGEIELIKDYPSKIASRLVEDEIDLGLVPVAVIPGLAESHIITDYCIGSNGRVASVCLFSEVPLNQIKRVLMDYQSRTSVALARLLLREFWKVDPEIINTTDEYQSEIRGSTAGLLIGDRALAQRNHSPYIYDLGEAWKLHTGLPFVFAAWVSNKKLPEDFVNAFNSANAEGLAHLDEIATLNANPNIDLKKYFTEFISYKLDEPKRKGLELFLERIKAEN